MLRNSEKKGSVLNPGAAFLQLVVKMVATARGGDQEEESGGR